MADPHHSFAPYWNLKNLIENIICLYLGSNPIESIISISFWWNFYTFLSKCVNASPYITLKKKKTQYVIFEYKTRANQEWKKIQIDFPKLHLFNFRTLNNLNPTFRHWHNSRYFRIPLTYYKDPTAHCTSKVYIKYSRVQNLETQNFLCVRMKLKLISFELCYCSRRD